MKTSWQFLIIMHLTLTLFFQCQKNINSPNRIISPDLSFKENPNGQWEIGYSSTYSLDPSQFRFCTSADTSDIIGMWHPTVDQSGYYPYLGQNRDKKSKVSNTNGWAVRAGQIAMEASNTGLNIPTKLYHPSAPKFTIYSARKFTSVCTLKSLRECFIISILVIYFFLSQ